MADVWQDMAELLVAHEHHPVYGPRLRRIAERMRELDEFQATIHAAMPALDDQSIDPSILDTLKSADGSELAVRAVDMPPADDLILPALSGGTVEGVIISSDVDGLPTNDLADEAKADAGKPSNQGKRTGKRRIG